MKRIVLIVAIYAVVAIAQQSQPQTQQKKDSTICGKHAVQVEKQSKCDDYCAEECCSETTAKCQKHQSSAVKPCKSSMTKKVEQPKNGETQSVKPADKPSGK